jgi:hypothetical protein
MKFLASLFIETNVVIVVLSAIIVFALYQYRVFSIKINPIISEFKQMNETLLKSGHSKTDFCAFYDSQFNDVMSKTIYLNDSWCVFKKHY